MGNHRHVGVMANYCIRRSVSEPRCSVSKASCNPAVLALILARRPTPAAVELPKADAKEVVLSMMLEKSGQK
jgi:hypothetical protein